MAYKLFTKINNRSDRKRKFLETGAHFFFATGTRNENMLSFLEQGRATAEQEHFLS